MQTGSSFLVHFQRRISPNSPAGGLPDSKFTEKEKGKFGVVLLRPPSNVELGNFTWQSAYSDGKELYQKV